MLTLFARSQLIAKSNHGFLATHEGVDVGGERLGKEVQHARPPAGSSERSVLMSVNLCPQVIEFAKKMTACHKGGDKKLRFSIIGAADRSCCRLWNFTLTRLCVEPLALGSTMQATPWAACTRDTASATSMPRDFLTSGNLSYAPAFSSFSHCRFFSLTARGVHT